MKKRYIVSALIATMIFTSTTAFAAGNSGGSTTTANKNCIKRVYKLPDNFEKMSLTEKKSWFITNYTEKINSKVKEGKITKEQGDSLIKDMTDKVNQWDGKEPLPLPHGMSHKIKLPDNFEKMSLQEKKNWLITNYTEKINKDIKEGKITKEQGDSFINSSKDKINQWDGKTPLPILPSMNEHKMKLPDNFENMNLQEKRNWLITNYTEKVNQSVKEGKITKEQGDEFITKMKEKINSWDGTLPIKNIKSNQKTS